MVIAISFGELVKQEKLLGSQQNIRIVDTMIC